MQFPNQVIYFLILYFSDQFFLVFSFPGCLAHKHLEKDDAERPNVSFEGILIPLEGLRGHV